MRCQRIFSLLLVLVLTAWGQPAAAAAQGKPAGGAGRVVEGVALDFKEIELPDLIKTVSELTGKNFVYDETVKGKVTIISPKRMSLAEAYNVFLAVLRVKGFTVVPSGKINKIVPIRDVKEESVPTRRQPRPSEPEEQFVTRLIPLSNVNADLIVNTVLKPLVPKTSNIVAYAPTNTLIITDTAGNIDRLFEIVQALDVEAGAEMLEVIALENAEAVEVAQILNQVLVQRAAAPTARRRTAAAAAAAGAAGAEGVATIIPYERTNSLVVMASEEDMAAVRSLVEKLDQGATQARAGLYVFYLQNADAESLAKTLNEILTGIKTQARATPARAGQPPAAATVATGPVTVTADKPTNALVINATPEDYQTIREIINQLDIKRKQVFVEALILELSMDAVKRLGLSLQGAADVGNDSVVFGTSNLNSSFDSSINLGGLLPASAGGVPTILTQAINGILVGGLFNPVTVTGPDGSLITVPALSVLLDLAKTDSDVNVLSAPRLLTSDNEEAEIIVGSNVPIITQRLTDTGATGLAQSVSVERQDVALTLRFTPQITEGNLVRLDVYQEITEIAPSSATVGNINEVGPTLTKRLLRNTVVAEDGRTVVLGGLFSKNIQNEVRKVPLLGDLPLLGWLFRSKRDTVRKTSLLIFINPKIIRDAEDLARVTRRSHEVMRSFRTEEGVMEPLIASPPGAAKTELPAPPGSGAVPEE